MRVPVFLFFIFSVSCQGVDKKGIVEYFDIAAVINEQYRLLESREATLSKVAIFGSDTAKAAIVPDNSQWKSELGIFERIDINKPQWRGQYRVEDSEDTFSNLTIRTFTTTSDEAEIKYLRLYFLDDVTDLRRIEARWHENNPVYKSQRDFTLHFEDMNNSIIINGYEIKGIQKMMFQDEVSFSINAGINYL